MSKVEELIDEEFAACPVSPGKDVKKKKKKKKDKKDDDDVSKEKSKKKKKSKKKEVDELADSLNDSSLIETPAIVPKTTMDFVSPIGINPKLLESPGDGSKPVLSLTSKDYDKWGVDYFEALLVEIRAKCERKLKIREKDRESFISACQNFYESWQDKQENDKWLMELAEGNNSKKKKSGGKSTEEVLEAQTEYGNDLEVLLNQRKRKSIKSALNVFMGLNEDALNRIQEILVKGAIIAQATPKKLADFASKGKRNKKLLKRLFGDTQLMKEMLLHGGAAKYEYGEAIRIFVDCMEVDKKSKKKTAEKPEGEEEDEDFEDDDWSKIHRKIALACALELASPIYYFDTATNLDPVERYKHFVEAHRAGELDPAFPYFSIWEMRQIVNCDAPNDQMAWCRKMVMNYAPHVTCLTDVTLRYVYMLQSDVRIRKPTWTGSPRTYQMVLSGGGNESVNSWFGRFMLKSFGMPSWGSKFRRKEGYTRWTPEGWVALNGSDWNDWSWRGKTAKDFKTELEARNKAPPEEYFKRLVTLQCLADIVDGDPNKISDEEKDVLHPERMWRSMAIVSMELLFQTEPEVVRTFKREGPGLVETNCQKYLEKYQEDAPDKEIKYSKKNEKLTIPASRHGFKGGNTLVIESFEGGKQLNFVADGDVEYEVPDDVPSQSYNLSLELCTVSSKQVPLFFKARDEAEPVEIPIPYTQGEWEKTDGVIVDIEGGNTLRFSRPKGSLGLAVKKFIFEAI